ncbi:alpha/beta fold hydrolase [Robiginitalea sp. SC105]|uniref:alpha/beta fold hydrolase n=1 Tax=Robiginitalea sp. SC105 TaxID=2762332 RepID=UPI001639A349|nr:alpha/beta hydrolase [Robiginitalea sp. SC105]MBC2839439.1 alpha/beta hydrolase [Robiginitalea sp. SC105]
MPGLAASPDIFEHISLSEARFRIHYLEWFLPEAGMSLLDYARKMSEQVGEANPVLIGVSFGGMLVQEMTRFLSVRKVIIISSIKSRNEMPRRLLVARYTKLHKLLPTSLVNNVEVLSRVAFGEAIGKRLKLYERYLGIRDAGYLDWSIDKIVNWDREEPVPGLVHIHGEKDAVFPFSYIGDCIAIPEGTHTMILHRHRWFNEHLPAIILQDGSSI